MISNDEAWAQLRAFSSTDDWPLVRRVASVDLERDMRESYGDDHGHGISSSDVNHHAVGMLRSDPDGFAQALENERADERIRKIIAGWSPEKLARARQMFAPIN